MPHIDLWEPCCFTKVPNGPQTCTLDVLWLQEEGTQIHMSDLDIWLAVQHSITFLLLLLFVYQVGNNKKVIH